ncbi:MAG: beta-phosphoglucomutase [Natronospirillum sp.]
MSSFAFKAAIFDLDGVIANTAQYQYLSWKSLADDEGFSVPATLGDQVRGVARDKSLEIVLSYANRTYSAAEKETLSARKNRRYHEMISQLSADDLLPGASELITTLKANGVRIALASASRNARAVLTALGVMGQFDYIADANKITHPKPDPEIFLTAAQGLAMKPQECLGLEDSVAGVTAIKASNMFALGVGCPNRLTQADAVVSSLREVNPEQYFALVAQV